MPKLLNTWFGIMAVALAVMLIWRFVLLLWRVEYAESIIARTAESQDRLIDGYRKIILVMKPMLWLLPVVGITMPIAVYFFTPEINAWMILAAMAECTLLVAVEYYFETWLIRYLKDHKNKSSSAAPAWRP
jgi:hypothetical protein